MQRKQYGRQRNKIKNVLILLWSSTIASGRDFLSGLGLRARNRRDWHLHLRMTKRIIEPNILEAIERGEYDGVITDEDTFNSLPLADIPDTTSIIVFGTYNPAAPSNVAFVQTDNASIAQFGAEYLLRLGRFRTFAFVPTEIEHGWSRIRATAFAETVRRHHFRAEVFEHSSGAVSLDEWLAALSKPAAIMAACDTTALEVLETCKRAGIAVPEQVSILGVDNDEFLCEFTSPTISSVMPRHDKVGELADLALARMFRGWPKGRARMQICNEQTVVERESTAPIAPAAHLITSALDFIRHNATRDLRVKDVVEHLGISRSLADLRFREYQGESIGDVIRKARLEEVARLLVVTDMSVTKIARACGFADVSHLQVMFKKRFGLPMRRWRQQHADAHFDS